MTISRLFEVISDDQKKNTAPAYINGFRAQYTLQERRKKHYNRNYINIVEFYI